MSLAPVLQLHQFNAAAAPFAPTFVNAARQPPNVPQPPQPLMHSSSSPYFALHSDQRLPHARSRAVAAFSFECGHDLTDPFQQQPQQHELHPQQQFHPVGSWSHQPPTPQQQQQQQHVWYSEHPSHQQLQPPIYTQAPQVAPVVAFTAQALRVSGESALAKDSQLQS